jgi:hypothetical protein
MGEMPDDFAVTRGHVVTGGDLVHGPVTRAWLGWAGTAPDQITARLTLAAGHDPDQPPTAEVLGAVLGHQSDAMGLLEQLTARVPAGPATMLQEMPYRDALRHWARPTGERLDGEHSGRLLPRSPTGRPCTWSSTPPPRNPTRARQKRQPRGGGPGDPGSGCTATVLSP